MIPDQKLIAAIGERQSIRRFHREPVARTVVERLLAAATRAPSAHNRQPWRFVVLDGETSKQRLAKAMGERLHSDRAADGDEMSAIDADVSRSYSRITGAPLVIVVCVDARVMDHYPDRRRNEVEYLMAVQSTAMAVQNLLLAAQSEGLGACVMVRAAFLSRHGRRCARFTSRMEGADAGRDRRRCARRQRAAAACGRTDRDLGVRRRPLPALLLTFSS